MADQQLILRPNAELSAAVPWVVVGGGAQTAAGRIAAISDNPTFGAHAADATYLNNPAVTGTTVMQIYSFTTATVPAGAFIRNLDIIARLQMPNANSSTRLEFQRYDEYSPGLYQLMDEYVGYIDHDNDIGGTFIATVGGYQALAWDMEEFPATPWEQAYIDRVAVGFRRMPGYLSGDIRLMELYVVVNYNMPATVVVTGPTGAVTSSNQPNVTWTYTDPEGDPQDRAMVKVFNQAQYDAGGFNPETSPAVWSTESVGTGLTKQIGVQLPLGVNHKAYVKADDMGFDQRWSAWAAGPVFSIASGGGVWLDPSAVPV